MNTTNNCPQLLDLAAEHLTAAAHHAEANARGELTSPWHSFAGHLQHPAGGVSPVGDDEPVATRPLRHRHHR